MMIPIYKVQTNKVIRSGNFTDVVKARQYAHKLAQRETYVELIEFDNAYTVGEVIAVWYNGVRQLAEGVDHET